MFGVSLEFLQIAALSAVIFGSLLLVFFYFWFYFKNRHQKDKYNGEAGSQPAHFDFREIKYRTWLVKHLPKWLQPKSVRDHPHKSYSLVDGILVFIFHRHFSFLRKTVALWLIFSIVFSSFGIYFLQHAPNVRASGDFSIKTGYYYGTGASQSVTGIGFAPEVVIIKSDTAAGSMVFKTASMSAAVTSYLGVATADNTETEITLGADGFTVSAALEVNTVSTRYVYIAYAGSDCTSGGVMCVGSYTGNGSATQTITTGFQPDLMIVKRSTAVVGNFRTSSMTDNHAGFFSAAANDTTGVYYTSIASTGFTVGLTNNANASTYYYLAFKNVSSKLTVGQFTGDGTDSRNITGLGFEPDFVFVKQNAAIVPAFNTTECWGDLSNVTTAAVGAVNHIQSLDADGFQVGSSTSVNASGVVSHYFAFGGVADPSPSGSFYMEKGSYTGNGTSQTITTTFAPDLVFIKGNTTEYGVWATSLDNNITHYFALSAVGFANGVTSMTSTGFTVGTSTTVNTNAITYEWVAYGNATSPKKAAGAADFMIGSHTGNGLSPRSIDHLGMAPSMVVVKRPITTAALSHWTSSAMAANTGEYFSATADLTDGTGFRSLDSSGGGGFTIGTSAMMNTVNVAYVWFAFKEGANFDVGSHTGSGVAKDVTGLGFDPDYVWTKRSTAVSAMNRSTSSTITTTTSQYFLNSSNVANEITGFVTDGFSVGTATEVNASGGAYQYAAWNSTTSLAAPSTPTNSAPTSSATGQDLNATLTGSAYSDSDENAQTDSMWQVDDDSDFATPVWTRTAGASGVTTAVTAANGTFANELSGETELDHNTSYYWRVKYSDGVYSSWSTATSFTTNTIATPTHSSPSDQGTVTTLTPTLTASAFSDSQSGHTASNAQWQISSTSSFSSTVYDSSTVSYGASLVVPAATLSNGNVYYWRVRYQDSSSQWSSYSTTTRFLVQQSTSSSGSIATFKPLFGSTVVDQGDTVKIDAQFLSSSGSPINDAAATINVYNPSGALIVTAASMSYVSSSNGIYRYAYTIPSANGSYLYDVTASSSGTLGYGAANFEVRTIGADVTSAKTTINTVSTNVNTINTNVSTVKNATVSVTGSVVDTSPSDSSFKTDLTSTKDDFYKNMAITFTSGENSGQSRRVSGYSQSDKKISVDPQFSFTPANGDTFLISVGSLRAEELSGSAKSTIESVQTKLNLLAGSLPSDYSGAYSQLVAIATQLSSLGVIQGSGANSLYSLSSASKDDIQYLKNKMLDLQAALEINKVLLSGGNQNSVVSTWYTYHSVVMNMLIANPTERQATIPFKAYLPKEVRPENVISTNGLKLEFDEGAHAYFVSGEFDLSGKESVTRQVEIKDIWQLDETELIDYKVQAGDMYNEAQKTAYSAQVLVLKNDVVSRIDKILRKQKENNENPQEHIQSFRDNQEDLEIVKANLKSMTTLVTSAGAGNVLTASLGGIQLASSWSIVVILAVGLVILGAFSYRMWKHQMIVLAALTERSTKAVGKTKKKGHQRAEGDDLQDNVVDEQLVHELKSPIVKMSIPEFTIDWANFMPKVKWIAAAAVLGVFSYTAVQLNPFKPEVKGTEKTGEVTNKSTTVVPEAVTPTLAAIKEKTLEITGSETGWVNLRAGSGTKYKILEKVNIGTIVTELGREVNEVKEEWIQIKTGGGSEGWVLGKYVADVVDAKK